MTHPQQSSDALEIWKAGVAGANAERLVLRHVSIAQRNLTIGKQSFSLDELSQICVVGAGKATAAMADGLYQSLVGTSDRLPRLPFKVIGQINVPDQHSTRFTFIDTRQVRPESSNAPTEKAVRSSRQLVELVRSLPPASLCIALISGGASALLCDPVSGISLAEKLHTTALLTEAGCDIWQLNTVRQCLSSVKAGGLKAACRSRNFAALVLSDVIGDDLRMIGSGPTVDCRPDVSKAIEIIRLFDLESNVAPSVLSHLMKRESCDLANHNNRTRDLEPPELNHTIIGNPETAIQAAATQARKLGYQVVTELSRPPESLNDKAEQLARDLSVAAPGTCLISAGEPTLKLVDAERRGQGGRNQQLALRALQTWINLERNSDAEFSRAFCLLSAGTDGQDGNTPFAGAWADSQTVSSANRLSLDLNQYLESNDAGTFFGETENLISTGPTQANVCDLRVFLVGKSPSG